jgi:hypothetical protein
MKKIFFTLQITLLILNFNNVYSQKQISGNLTTELQLSPLGSEPLKIDGLKFRKFIADNKAIRLNMFLGGKKTPSNTISNNVELKNTTSTFDLTFKPGYEIHFNGTNKLSPYVGSEILVGFSNNINSNQSLWGADSLSVSNNTIETKRVKDHKSVLGLNLFTGTDFYFAEKFYIGVEIGFGFLYNTKGYKSTTYNNPSDVNSIDKKTKGTSPEFTWGPNYQGTFRIGYCIK